MKALLARLVGFETYALISARNECSEVSHYCFSRREALEWMACYGIVAAEVHIYCRNRLIARRFPRSA